MGAFQADTNYKEFLVGFFSEFKEFAMRGNVMDMAVGIVIGAAFKDIVTALVDKIIMPITGALSGGADLSDRSTTIEVTRLAEGVEAHRYRLGSFCPSDH